MLPMHIQRPNVNDFEYRKIRIVPGNYTIDSLLTQLNLQFKKSMRDILILYYTTTDTSGNIYDLEGNFRILVDFIYLIYNKNNHLNPEFDNNYLSKLVSKYSKKEFKYEELDKILSFKRFKQMYA